MDNVDSDDTNDPKKIFKYLFLKEFFAKNYLIVTIWISIKKNDEYNNVYWILPKNFF